MLVNPVRNFNKKSQKSLEKKGRVKFAEKLMHPFEISNVVKTHNQKIEKLAKKYDLNLLLLFGSRVKYKKFLHEESDFDVAYLSKRELFGKEIIALNCDLMDIFNSDRVDLTDLKNTNPFLRYEIAKNSLLLYGKEMEYLEFKAFAFKDYINHKPLFGLTTVLIRRRHQLLKEKMYGK